MALPGPPIQSDGYDAFSNAFRFAGHYDTTRVVIILLVVSGGFDGRRRANQHLCFVGPPPAQSLYS